MKKITLLVVFAFIAFTSFGQSIVSSISGNGTPTDSRGTDCGSTIPNFTTTDDGLGGNPSQDFEAVNDAFDAQSADDFQLTGAAGAICQVAITGTLSIAGVGFDDDPNSMIIMEIWDDNAGLPGTMIYTETLPTAGLDPGATGSFVISPAGAPVLQPDTTYWLSIIVQMEFATGGQWFWASSSDGLGNAWAFQNPGDGFGSGCTVWTDGQFCLGTATPDRAMDIAFEESLSVDDNILSESLSLYPNPTNNDLSLDFSRNFGQTNVQITSITGQVVMDTTVDGVIGTTRLATNDLSAGIYFAQVSTENLSTVIKFIKN